MFVLHDDSLHSIAPQATDAATIATSWHTRLHLIAYPKGTLDDDLIPAGDTIVPEQPDGAPP